MTRILFAAAVVLLGLVNAAPASAHADLVSTLPAANTTVAAPALVSVAFDEPVRPAPDALTVTDAAGAPVAIGEPETSADGTVVQARVLGQLHPGTVNVRWRILSGDDHVEEGAFAFVVEASADHAAPAHTPGEAAAPELAAVSLTPTSAPSTTAAPGIAAHLAVTSEQDDSRLGDLGLRPFTFGAAAALGAMAIVVASTRTRRTKD